MVTVKTRSLVPSASDDQPQSVTLPAKPVLVAVVSHDCEFNEGKRNKLLVARIQGVQQNLSPEQTQDLRDSNDVEARAAAGLDIAGVDGFVFHPAPGLFDEERAVCFTTATPLPMTLCDDLLSLKKAELEHSHRVLFRKKLAWFFGREADDIDDDEKHVPGA